MVAEFEDATLTKSVATSGHEFIAVPTVVASEAVERYGFVPIGRTKEVVSRFYAITAERRFTHPAILAITEKLRPARKKQGPKA